MKSYQHDRDDSQFVEFDPTRRYGRYNEILGKGSTKIVYKAFDEYDGVEVAWNQVKLNNFLSRPEDLQRLYCEIHLLKTLKHKHIMKFYTSWVDMSKRNINFVTELFKPGTLRQYRQKYRRVKMRAVKHWCRQILEGLLYLHSHDPPIIHRDLKCDNIFINGNKGVVKIGDLGLATKLRKSHTAHCVGTPEFMAPEVYEEDYNELVDIYSFGMCVLEMVTLEYPYSECTHPAQIYKKVISGTKPEALYRVQDPEVREFVEKCLTTALRRPSARELLKDPFLQIGDQGLGSWEGDIREICEFLRSPRELCRDGSLISNGFADDHLHEIEMQNRWNYSDPEKSRMLRQASSNLLLNNASLISNGFACDRPDEKMEDNGWGSNAPDLRKHVTDIFCRQEDEHSHNVGITIKGARGEDGSIYLRLRIAGEEGHIRNIHFPFDIRTDTALDVATEMVRELGISDCGVTRIEKMIDSEVSSLVPEWKPSLSKKVPGFPTTTFADICPSIVSSCCSGFPSTTLADICPSIVSSCCSGFPRTTFADICPSIVSSCCSLIDFLSVDTSGCTNLQSTNCSELSDSAISGQLDERTYQVEGSEQCMINGTPVASTIQSNVLDQSFEASRESQSDEEGDQFHGSANNRKEIHVNNKTQTGKRESVDKFHYNSIQHQSLEAAKSRFQCSPVISKNYVDKVRRELKRLKSKRQVEQKDNRNQQLDGQVHDPPLNNVKRDYRVKNTDAVPSATTLVKASSEKTRKPIRFGKRLTFNIRPRRNLLQRSKRFSDNDVGYSHRSNPDRGTDEGQYCGWPKSQFREVNPKSREENITQQRVSILDIFEALFSRFKSLPEKGSSASSS